MQKTTTLIISGIIFFACCVLGPSAYAQSLDMKWKDAAGSESAAKVRTILSDSEGRQLMFLAFETPVPDAKSAGYLDEGVGDDTDIAELPVIPVKESKGKKYLLLYRKAAKVKVIGENGAATVFSYELAPTKSSLQISPSCRNLQFKVKTITEDNASFPAMIVCKVVNGVIEEMTFSTLDEAEWFGSAAFENAGKGERWKSFVYKDISTLGIWEMSWGDPNAKTVGKVLIPKPNKKIPVPPKPTLIFMAGVQYVTGSATKDPKSGDIAGVQIPLSVQYQKDGSWWFLGSAYDLFVLSTAQSDAGSNSLSDLGAWAGAETKFSSFSLRGSLGYSSRSMTVPEVGVTSTFEAPRLGVDLHYAMAESTMGVELVMAQTSTEGTYEEMTATAFYQTKLLFSKETRLQFGTTTIKAASKNMDVEASWMSLGLAIQF